MTRVCLRTPGGADWHRILELADAALPWDAGGNREWLENRRQFAGRRRHYVVEGGGAGEEAPGRAVGYGAVEEGPEPGSFRMFVVMAPELLASEAGAVLYVRLAADLAALKATNVWVREYARDMALLAFLRERGFEERERFSPPGYEEMVVMAKALAES